MAEIYVQSSQALQDVIDQLTAMRRQFNEKAVAIQQEQVSLTQKWEGDASTAFSEHFNEEYPNFQLLYDTLGDYILALQTIKEQYESAEETNKGIAQN